MQNIVDLCLESSKLTQRELALRSGLSPSTVTRIRRGEVDPTMGTIEAMLASAGLQLATPSRLCDPAAIAVARTIIDSNGERGIDEPWGKTLIRWASPDGIPNPKGLAKAAGQAAPLRDRPGAILISTEWAALRILSTISATRTKWASSGRAGAHQIGAPSPVGPEVVYVDDLHTAEFALSQSPRGDNEVLLLPFDGSSEKGAWSSSGIVWVDPLQIIMDCFSDPELSPAAVKLTEGW